MSVVAVDLHVRHVDAVLQQRADQRLGLLRGVQPVGGVADHEEPRRDLLESVGERGAAVGQVEVVDGLRDEQEGVGVEALGEVVALVLEIALDRELGREIVAQLLALLQPPPELFPHGPVAQVRDVPDHPGDRKPVPGRLAAVVIAPGPVRVGVDRLPRDLVERDALRRYLGRGRQDDRAPDARGIRNGPLEGLHSAHAAADDGQQRVDPEAVEQEPLRLDHVRDGQHRELEAEGLAGLRVDGGGAGAALAAADHVGAEEEVLVRVEGAAGPDGLVPPAGLFIRGRVAPGDVGVAGEGVEDQDGVAAVGVERPVGLVGDRERGRQRRPALQLERFVECRVLRLDDVVQPILRRVISAHHNTGQGAIP